MQRKKGRKERGNGRDRIKEGISERGRENRRFKGETMIREVGKEEEIGKRERKWKKGRER